MVAPIILAMYIYTQPESPRWLLAKAHRTADRKKSAQYYDRVFQSLKRLRNCKLLAARDMILIHYRLLKEDELRREAKTVWYRRGVYELFSIRRNRRAVIASLIVMYELPPSHTVDFENPEPCGLEQTRIKSEYFARTHGSDSLTLKFAYEEKLLIES